VEESHPGKAESRIIQEILAYLLDHPDAQDSLEGVVEWWLREQAIRHRIGLVKAALKQLVKNNFVIEKEIESHFPVYRLNPEKVREARAFIEIEPSGFFPCLTE
jgi:hypothetical protein